MNDKRDKDAIFKKINDEEQKFNLNETQKGKIKDLTKFITDINENQESDWKSTHKGKFENFNESKFEIDCVEEFLCTNNSCPEMGYVLIRKQNKEHPQFKRCFCDKEMYKSLKKFSYFSSPFISKVIEYNETDKFFFVVMEYPKGISLSELVKTIKLRDIDLQNIFRQVAIAISHCQLRKLALGYITLDNIIIDYELIKGDLGYQEGVSIILHNFGLKWTTIDKDQLAPELMMQKESSFDIFNRYTDNQALGVCIQMSITQNKSPFAGKSDILQVKIKSDFNFYDKCFQDKDINLKDLIFSLMDGDLKSRHDVAIEHLYFTDYKKKLKKEPGSVNKSNQNVMIEKEDSTSSKNFQGIFDFLFRNYLFRKYKISNMDTIRFNFLDIDKDSSGDIDINEFIERGKLMLDKDDIELKEKYDSFRKFCFIIDQDAQVCSNARYESESVLDQILNIQSIINNNKSADCSLIEIYKQITSRTQTTDYKYDNFQQDIKDQRNNLAQSDIQQDRPQPNAIQNSGIQFLEFARLQFKVFFQEKWITRPLIAKFNKIVIKGYIELQFNEKSNLTRANFKNFVRYISWHELKQKGEKIIECFKIMENEYNKRERELNQMIIERDMVQEFDNIHGDVYINCDDEINKGEVLRERIEQKKIFKLLLQQNLLQVNIPDVFGFQVNFKNCIQNQFVLNKKLKDHCLINNNILRVSKQLQNYQYLILRPVLDYRTTHFYLRIRYNRQNPKNFGAYFALIDDLSEHNIIHGINLSGPSYNVSKNLDLNFDKISDGDILDLVWSTSENTLSSKSNNNAKKDSNSNNLSEKEKLQLRNLNVSWQYNEIKIAEFNLDTIADKRYKLVLSVMHLHDELEILMI